MQNCSDLTDFVAGSTVGQQWDAARRLMASKKLQGSAADHIFTEAFDSLALAAQEGESLDRILAVDLIVRMSAAARTLQGRASGLLRTALRCPLPPAWIVSDTATLPAGAKPAEIRENVAQALAHASGEWVSSYLVQALAREDRSQRCRIELCRQLLARDPSIGDWLRSLTREPWQEILPDTAPVDTRLNRLRDLASALSDVVSANRTTSVLSPDDGSALASFSRAVARVPPREMPGPRLAAAASEIVHLLDEMIAAEFTLATEPQSYEVLETIQGWWRPYSFPKDLVTDLTHLVRRLRSAITLRARMGQRSDSLANRLSQALGPGARVADVLTAIADANEGLAGEVDDWLRGRTRAASVTAKAASALLGAATTGDFIVAFAPILLDCKKVRERPSGQDSDLVRICNSVDVIAIALRLSIAGHEGDLVEYSPAVHTTADGSVPADPLVRIVRPAVVRERLGGSSDIVVRATVVPVSGGSSAIT